MSTPLWKDRERSFPTSELTPAAHYDAVVVGAGLTGLISALLLLHEGKSVIVIESHDVGAGASGATTAKASLLQGNRLSQIAKTFDKELAAAYLAGHQLGLGWLTAFCDEHGVDIQRPSAWTFARTEKGISDVEKEHEVAQELGLPTVLHTSVAAPFPVHAAVELPNQLQLNPLDLLMALSVAVTESGGTIVDHCRVITIDTDDSRASVETAHGIVTSDHVVLATASPILDRGKTSAQLSPQRSYLCSFDYAGDIPDGMLISVESPTRSLRTAVVDDTRYLLVGGNGHRTGTPESTQAQLDEIVEWTSEHFPGARLTHSWSAQDYHPVSMIPMVRTLPWGDDRVHFAGGYSKWGLTGAPASAREVVDLVLGRPDAEPFGSPGAWGKVKSTFKTMSDMPGPTAKAAMDAARTDLSEDSHEASAAAAETGHVGKKPVGETIIDGRPCQVSLVCPHMGAILAWNDSEESWDCPLHGSRFEADGTLIEGPATTDLDRIT